MLPAFTKPAVHARVVFVNEFFYVGLSSRLFALLLLVCVCVLHSVLQHIYVRNTHDVYKYT